MWSPMEQEELRVRDMNAQEVRVRIRNNEYAGPTSGLAAESAQANLVILPREYAFDFLKFCVRNPKPCPVLEVTDTGSPEPLVTAPGAGLRIAHVDQGRNVPMYTTKRDCVPSGAFAGPLVVSMRPYRAEELPLVVSVTGRYPSMHGAPIHVGAPEALGIEDIDDPEFGDPVAIEEGQIPVFWACGVTPQAVAMSAKAPLMITHSPGYMFITDRRHSEYEV